MIGNRQGWFISALIAVSGGWLLFLGSQRPKVSQPSGTIPDLLAKVALPNDPKNVMPVATDRDCDAGEMYRAAIEEYLNNRRQYEKWFESATAARDARPKAVELVADAAGCARSTLFRPRPAEVLNYQPENPALDALDQLGHMAIQRGILHLRAKNPEESRRYLAAAFVLGARLYDERLSWLEFTAGVNLMTDAAKYLAQLENSLGNADRAQATEAFALAADKYKLKQLEVYRFVSSIDGPTIARHGGDVFALARSSAEPMWRGEAILALGRMRYNTPRRGDQLGAAREIRQWVTDPDPVVRTAATAADKLTLEEYRMLK